MKQSTRNRLGWIVGTVLLVACGENSAKPPSVGESVAQILTRNVPADAACIHIEATRLSDYTVTSFQGLIAGATFSTVTGEARVSATAYPEPCSAQPAKAPWVSSAQLFTFASGSNTLTLTFHPNPAVVAVDPVFDDGTSGGLVLRPGSMRRLGRNNEDVAGPDLALDGWEVKQFAVPPVSGGPSPDGGYPVPYDGGFLANGWQASERVLFSMEGQDGMASTPRGLAHLSDGTFVAQLSSATEPLRLFGPTGAFLGRWPVVYGVGLVPADSADGLEAIDATRFVRTAYSNAGTPCDAPGSCSHALIEFLERTTAADGTPHLQVTRQVPLPAPYDQEYAVGVMALKNLIGVTTWSTLPQSISSLIVMDESGTLVAGPTVVDGDLEGLFLSADGRLGAMDYHGRVAMFDLKALSPRPGETASYVLGADVSTPVAAAWDSAHGAFVMATSEAQLQMVNPDFAFSYPLPIDLSRYVQIAAVGVSPDASQLFVADQVPPMDPVTRTRVPAIDVYASAAYQLQSTVRLAGVPLPAYPRTFAYVAKRKQFVSNYRRPSWSTDSSLDAIVYTHAADGTLVSSFDLASLGVRRVLEVADLPVSDELLLYVKDEFGVPRFLVTSSDGHPRRSFKDTVGGISALALITSGLHAGDVALIRSEPSTLLRIASP